MSSQNNDFSQVLLGGTSPNAQVRQEMQNRMNELKKNIPLYMKLLAEEVGTEGKPPAARQMAGLLLKQLFESKDKAVQAKKAKDWMNFNQQMRNHIKTQLLNGLKSSVRPAQSAASLVIAKIAQIELPFGQWPQLLQGLLFNVTKGQSVAAKQASLECLGFICEDIDPKVLKGKSNEILIAIVNGMRKESGNFDVILAACKALNNCLEFITSNMKVKQERDYIMRVVCAAAQMPNERIRSEALSVLSGIAALYYEHLDAYMSHIFSITMNAMKKDVENVAKQAIEFWSTVCDREIDILDDEEFCRETNTQPEQKCLGLITKALKFLIPPLLETLTKQDECDDEDDWDVAMSGATCLGLVAEVVGDAIVQKVLPFVTKNIKSNDWKLREASSMAFGAILEGPSEEALRSSINGALPILVDQLKDRSLPVRDTGAWTLGRICQLHPETVRPHIDKLLAPLCTGMNDEPRVANNCCFAIHNIASSFKFSQSKTSPMSQYFTPLIKALLKCADRNDATEKNLRSSAYETITCIVSHSALDTHPLVKHLCSLFLERLQKTFAMQANSNSAKEARIEVQGYLCSVLLCIAQKLDEDIKPYAHKMLLLFLEIFKTGSKNASVHEDALMAVGTVANALGQDFRQYIQHFVEYLFIGLRATNQAQVCTAAVGAVGDVCRALKVQIKPYCPKFIEALLASLSKVNNSVRPHIISCVGDIAIAIGGHFTPYLQRVSQMLVHAGQIQKKQDDEDFNFYVDQLRESVFDCYTGILHGLSNDKQQDKFAPLLESLNTLITRCWQDQRTPEITKAIIGLIGDLCGMGNNVRNMLTHKTIQFILNQSKSDSDTEIRELAHWAIGEIQSL